MTKHKGFPSGLSGTGFQFTIRRANPKGITPIRKRQRVADRSPKDRRADLGFLRALWENFGDQPFERGNLDAGRVSWLFGQEVVAAESPFNPACYESMLQIDEAIARKNFPEIFEDQ